LFPVKSDHHKTLFVEKQLSTGQLNRKTIPLWLVVNFAVQHFLLHWLNFGDNVTIVSEFPKHVFIYTPRMLPLFLSFVNHLPFEPTTRS